MTTLVITNFAVLKIRALIYVEDDVIFFTGNRNRKKELQIQRGLE